MGKRPYSCTQSLPASPSSHPAPIKAPGIAWNNWVIQLLKTPKAAGVWEVMLHSQWGRLVCQAKPPGLRGEKAAIRSSARRDFTRRCSRSQPGNNGISKETSPTARQGFFTQGSPLLCLQDDRWYLYRVPLINGPARPCKSVLAQRCAP